MPFALIIIGAVLLVAAVRNTTNDLYKLVHGDFSDKTNGKGTFVAWLLAILIIGALGYIKTLQPLSRIFLVLVVAVLFLDNGGVFAKFNLGVFSNTKSSSSNLGTSQNDSSASPGGSLSNSGINPVFSNTISY